MTLRNCDVRFAEAARAPHALLLLLLQSSYASLGPFFLGFPPKSYSNPKLAVGEDQWPRHRREPAVISRARSGPGWYTFSGPHSVLDNVPRSLPWPPQS